MAVVALKFALLFYTILCVKKASLTNSNSCCYSFDGDIPEDINDTYSTSSIWVYKQEKGLVLQSKSAVQILLILAGDVEVLPGPVTQSCIKCLKIIRKNQSAAACVNCKEKLHTKCLIDRYDGESEKLYCHICFVHCDQNIANASDINEINEIPVYEDLNNFTKARGLKLFHQNVNGLVSKINDIRILLEETSKNIHILGISESHLNKHTTNKEVTVDGYTIIRNDRSSGAGGGVCMFIRNDLKWQERPDLHNGSIEAIWIEVFIQKSKSILLCMLYRPPDSSKHLSNDFETKFDDMITTAITDEHEVIIMGDLNCNYLSPTDHKVIKNCIKLNGLKQIIKQPTRTTCESSTLIDIIATTHEQNLLKQIVYSNSLSDHDLIGIIRKMNCRKFQPRKIQTRNFSRYNKEQFKSDLRQAPWDNIINTHINLNDIWNSFKNHLLSIIDIHAPMIQKIVRGRDCPWLTTDIKSKMKERDFLLKKAKKSGISGDWMTYKRLRNSTTYAIRKSKATYNRSLFNENLNSPKLFWNQIKKCYPSKEEKSMPSKVFDIEGNVSADKNCIAVGFCTYFTGVAKLLQMSLVTLGNKIWSHHNNEDLLMKVNPEDIQFSFHEISAHDITKIVNQLKRSVASGYDNIPTSMIKDGVEELATPLAYLINSCLLQSVFPGAEKCAKISPVYKSGKRSSMDNYRPISVLPVLSKVFEKVVQKQIYQYLEENSFLSPNQFAFRKNRSTQHAVTYLSDHIRDHMDRGELTGAVFIDLKKAFDTIDHGRLLSKLPCYGIRNRELAWFEDYLFGRKQFVAFESVTSDWQTVLSGVPQGSVLGPLLFVLLINDIDLQLQKCEILLYADDTVVFTSDKACETIESDLNADLVNLARWFSDNQLVLNLKQGKTEFVLFGTSKKLNKLPKVVVEINGTNINEVDSYKYLGVEMDKTLNYNKHVDSVVKKASARVKLLSRIRQNINPHVAEVIYKVMIESTLMYCNNLFLGMSNTTMFRLQRIQDRAFRIISDYGKHNILNGWSPITAVREQRCADEVFKCLHGLAPEKLNGKFEKFSHQRETRGNNSKLRLPKVKTESGRKMFSFQGALIFNKLPADLRNEPSLIIFKQKCRQFFNGNL